MAVGELAVDGGKKANPLALADELAKKARQFLTALLKLSGSYLHLSISVTDGFSFFP
ncbi:hypothetical protein L1285_05625 [Pseudoalteromonas sp. DL2-H2.2]|uniref:hypothetical protein n=1 Tax=Pseudoalteromonas sp. DL2-H2.2 TaxID=2908889 RepID=UPI001F27CBA8|nr:hypothetical protein [Pseudoalteromonas sp. DL2-H2.2]MCF2907802.1 hypothetical protein [Pseudoalteromonas sp. DL2-H2.2]